MNSQMLENNVKIGGALRENGICRLKSRRRIEVRILGQHFHRSDYRPAQIVVKTRGFLRNEYLQRLNQVIEEIHQLGDAIGRKVIESVLHQGRTTKTIESSTVSGWMELTLRVAYSGKASYDQNKTKKQNCAFRFRFSAALDCFSFEIYLGETWNYGYQFPGMKRISSGWLGRRMLL